MRILHCYKDFDPPVHGGMERHIALNCRYQRDWAEVAALTCSRSWRTRVADRNGTQVTEVGEWGRVQSAPLAPMYPWHLRRLSADVRVIHMPNPTAELGCLLARPRGVLIARYHSDVVRQALAMKLYGPLQQAFLRKAHLIIATSQVYAETSPTLAPFLDKVAVVPMGIETERFDLLDYRGIADVRERYGGDYVLFAGRHRYYKGLQHLVDAAAAIHAPVVIAGEGPETARLKDRARDQGAEVYFPGMLSDADLAAHLHGCAVFAFPSIARSEAFGIAILEAHACGKPVVATTLGTGVEYANQHGETGLNVPPGDPGALAAAVNTLLGDVARRHQMGLHAAERVRHRFHARDVARREFALYEAALSDSG